MLLPRKLGLMLISLSALLMLSLPSFAQETDSIEAQIEALLAQMSLEEKIGQMTLVEKNSLTAEDVATYFIGGVLSGGGGSPSPNTVSNWVEMVHEFQDAALSTPLSIPLIYGIDAIHGNNNVYGAVIFPQNIGLGASRNPDLVRETARITALEMIATGIYWNYAPVLAVPQDIRWGRTYEGYSENTDLVNLLALAYLQGLQGDSLSDPLSVLGTLKHFVGDGGAVWGTSPFGENFIDRGITDVDEATLREIHLPPYISAIEAGAMSVMASYTSWGGLHMHAQHYLLTEVLKGELGFEGFVVSDWEAINAIDDDYYTAVVTSINAGVDMNMVPYDFLSFIEVMHDAVENGDISIERIDDAVRRILRAKFAMGLFDQPYADESLLEIVGSDEHRQVARQAVSESLVLLRNDDATLPLSADVETVFLAGSAADNIGIQSGGWTISWQGRAGNTTIGTTIRDGIEAALSETTDLRFDRYGRFEEETDADGNPLIADIGIVVIGEEPYAEFEGDDSALELSPADLNAINRVRAVSEKLVVILVSGRPLIITDALLQADAFVAAWLPGSEGAGVADVLFGDLPFTGRLPYTWPRSIDQLPFDFDALPTEGCEAPLFPFDYGLATDESESSWVALAIECALPAVEEEPSEGALAPTGLMGETYYAPFPVSITLDGDLSDWQGIPQVTLARGVDVASARFAAAADAEYLYLSADVTDDNIISGEHNADYWNEDSIEFYLNGTDNLELTSYTDGVAQLTIPPLNIGQAEGEEVIGGVRGESLNAQVRVTQTETGYAVEVAVPLESDVWSVTPIHEGEIGFQVHLNAASSLNRDTKLIWSIFDPGDQSYMNPSLFGRLIFFEVGQDFSAAPVATATPIVEIDTSVTWDSREWELFWSDEFEGEAGSPVNSENWTAEIGGHGWGNNELEYYTDRVENASLDGEGNLVITAIEETLPNTTCHYGQCRYTSARLITENNVEFTYGRVEMRAQIPRGQGIWPAFWMLGANFRQVGWPRSGELDILENVGYEPQTVHGTVHGSGYSGAGGIGGSLHADEAFADDFHIYAIDWDPNVIRWYVDGELFFMLSANDLNGRTWAFDHDFFMILNVAVGGNWPGSPDDTTVFPQRMIVDYVRVYQLAE